MWHTAERDLHTNVDEDEERQEVHLPQLEYLSVLVVFVVRNDRVDPRLTDFGQALCTQNGEKAAEDEE